MAGISSLHGLHQVAQKFSSTILPCRSESLTSWPCKSLSAMSGAGAPTRGGRPAMPSKPSRTKPIITEVRYRFIHKPRISLEGHGQACKVAHIGNQPAVIILDHRYLCEEIGPELVAHLHRNAWRKRQSGSAGIRHWPTFNLRIKHDVGSPSWGFGHYLQRAGKFIMNCVSPVELAGQSQNLKRLIIQPPTHHVDVPEPV